MQRWPASPRESSRNAAPLGTLDRIIGASSKPTRALLDDRCQRSLAHRSQDDSGDLADLLAFNVSKEWDRDRVASQRFGHRQAGARKGPGGWVRVGAVAPPTARGEV